MAAERNPKPSVAAFADRTAHTSMVMAPIVPPPKKGPKAVLAPLMTQVTTDFASATGLPPSTHFHPDTQPDGGERYSSFPHVTHAVPTRPAHVTSARFVKEVVGPEGKRINVLERFHQNDEPGAKPTRDRFIGADADTGQVYGVTAGFTPGVHVSKKHSAKGVLDRGGALDTDLLGKLTFAVGGVDDKSPPLSPRSRTRKLPDTGY